MRFESRRNRRWRRSGLETSPPFRSSRPPRRGCAWARSPRVVSYTGRDRSALRSCALQTVDQTLLDLAQLRVHRRVQAAACRLYQERAAREPRIGLKLDALTV